LSAYYKLSTEKIANQTHWSKQAAEDIRKSLNEYDNDTRKEARLKYGECRSCFYLKAHVAGQAFTKYDCKNCGETHTHENTAVPRYCRKCAEEHQACRRCGASTK